MSFKRLQKTIDKAIATLADHDEKKHEERYINLQNIVQESQEYIEKKVYSAEIDKELHEELKKCIKEFEKDRLVFIIFLVILCGMLFIGVFYITYSHFYDHFRPGKPVRPPHRTSRITSSSSVTSDSDITSAITTTKITTHSSDSTSTTSVSESTNVVTTTSKRVTTSYSDSTTSKSTTKATIVSTTKITTKPNEDSDEDEIGMVTVIFDTSSLVDLVDLYPSSDAGGLNSKPTTWKLSSSLSKGSKDYIVQYTINFEEQLAGITKVLDPSYLRFQLIAKSNGVDRYNSDIQELDDYPLIEYEPGKFYREIITLNESGTTFRNDETLDFELRMWIPETGVNQNELQNRQYKFKIMVEAVYSFCEAGVCKIN